MNWKLILKLGITALVVLGLGYRVWQDREALRVSTASSDASLNVYALMASGFLYIVGLMPCAVFWWLAMRDTGNRPTLVSTLAAYFAGHLAKYVPGKGLTIVVRATMVRGPSVSVMNAAIASAQETLLMMATGAGIAGILLLRIDVPQRALVCLVSIATAIGFVALMSPPFSARLSRLALKSFPSLAGQTVLVPIRWRTVFVGIAMIALGWLALSLSLGFVLIAMRPGSSLTAWDSTVIELMPRLVVVTCLSIVGGFLSMLPGGIGSREWIVTEILGPLVGTREALLAAVISRLVIIAAELVAAGVVWLMDRYWGAGVGLRVRSE